MAEKNKTGLMALVAVLVIILASIIIKIILISVMR